MMPLTLRAPSASPGVPPTKSGSAIGIGWMLPCVISRRTTAAAGRGISPASVAPAPNASRRRRVNVACCVGGLVPLIGPSAAEHLARIEGDFHVLPDVVGLLAEHVERLP